MLPISAPICSVSDDDDGAGGFGFRAHAAPQNNDMESKQQAAIW
jgi:hypothetical protein